MQRFICRPKLLVFFLLATLIANGCSLRVGLRTKAMLGGKIDVAVKLDDQMNRNSPLAVNLLIIYDEALLARLLDMTAKQWFESRDQMLRDFFHGKAFDYWGWEWTPGQHVPVQRLPLEPAAQGAVIFANYHSPGAHRIRFDPFKSIDLVFMEEEFTGVLDN
jgi:type VI secretion system protein